jgi:hypothetical protein
MSKQSIYLLLFHTEGFPHDEGFDISKSAQDVQKALSGVFTDILIYTPRKLKQLPGSENFCNFHEGEFSLNLGLNQIGCGDFKSFLIEYTLDQIPPNSLLIYHDCNFEKYVQYWQTDWSDLENICEYFLDQNFSDFFIPFEEKDHAGNYPKVKHFGKRYTTQYFFTDQELVRILEESPMLGSSRMIIRNTPASRQFFSDFRKFNEKKDLLTKWPNPDPHPEFIHSCPEQHILNLLVFKYITEGKLHPYFPRFRFCHRRMRIDEYLESYKNENLFNYLKKIQTIHDYNFRRCQELGKNLSCQRLCQTN